MSPRTKKRRWVESAKGEDPMKESTLAKITASVAAAKEMAQKALASSPNPERSARDKIADGEDLRKLPLHLRKNNCSAAQALRLTDAVAVPV